MTDALQQWCLQQLQLPPGEQPALDVVSGDASFRKYYRMALPRGGSVIAVHAPPDKEDNDAFVKVQQLLSAHAVCVPELLAWDRERGFLLLSDFGDRLLLPELNGNTVDGYYRQALEELLKLQTVNEAAEALPPYDSDRLLAEMQLFPEWFVSRLLGYPLSDGERDMLQRLFAKFIDSALEQPQVLVHRDFHSRNIMLLDDGRLGLIDFQDAVFGPITYDLVSLLRDCYVHWPEQQVRGWALAYRDRACEQQLMPSVSDEVFLRWFDWMGLQRHIKVLGIFARLWLRDGKQGYLRDLPLVIHYTLSVAGRYPECAEFVGWFRDRLSPLIAAQDWALDTEFMV